MKAKLNLSVEKSIVEEARAHGINISSVAEDAIAKANKRARNEAWVAENRDALDAYARQIEEEGPALKKYRRF